MLVSNTQGVNRGAKATADGAMGQKRLALRLYSTSELLSSPVLYNSHIDLHVLQKYSGNAVMAQSRRSSATRKMEKRSAASSAYSSSQSVLSTLSQAPEECII